MEKENNKEIQKITSVSEFINKVSEIRKERNKKLTEQQENTVLYFRGQSNIDWEIKPYIVRENLLSKESYLLRVTLSRCSSYFQNLTNDFDLLTKLQHYGLPTRLLDVTTNPLVALYFACNSSKNTEKADGVVYFGENICNYATDIEVQILSYLAFYLEKNKSVNDCNQLLQNKFFYLSEVLNNDENYEILFELFNKILLVQPNYNNERINRQSGMFLLPPLFEIKKDEKDISSSKIVRNSKLLSNYFNNKIIIDKNKKKEILEELDLYNIHEASLFPELEHQVNYLKNIIKNPTVENNIVISTLKKEAQFDKNNVKNLLYEYRDTYNQILKSYKLYENICKINDEYENLEKKIDEYIKLLKDFSEKNKNSKN